MDWLTDASDFVPRHCCGAWSNLWLTIYVAANVCIAFAYYAIPIGLIAAYWGSKAKVKQPWLAWLFSAFIVMCGTIHPDSCK